jgi:radical SAM superfamily enzyme YgiQ (UPF0313 family)
MIACFVIIASREVIMRTVIISLNSKYIHSSLAPWYLKASCGQYGSDCGEVLVSEHTINESMDTVLSSIYLLKPDIAAFSCYIWNISQALVLAENLKKLLPSSVIVLGGPEVSYDAGDILRNRPFVDFIIAGEGEASFPKLISMINGSWNRQDAVKGLYGYEVSAIDGLAFRSAEKIIVNKPAVIKDLDSIPSPYTDEMLSAVRNKIVYFEASRGCPFSCSYCLSSANEGVRYFSLARVFDDLDRLVRSGASRIKFVDRTFNANPRRSKEIMRHIIGLNKSLADGDRTVCNFHFEVGADLFDDESIELLNTAPRGLFQLEAGVQSTNGEALAAVCRKTDLDKLFSNISRIRKAGNVHIHADLIAGLPYEDYGSFSRSFCDVYSVRPHQLQLGFLKLLKGTRLMAQAEKLGYVFREQPPYEILSGSHISYDELVRLKGVAELVERYHNSGRFCFSLEFLIKRHFGSSFGFFESFYRYHAENGLFDSPVTLRDQYRIVNDFYMSLFLHREADGPTDVPFRPSEEDMLFFKELLRLDFLSYDSSGTLPGFMERRGTPGLREKCFDFLNDDGMVAGIIPQAVGMKPKQIVKYVHFEPMYIESSQERADGEISFTLFRPVNEPVIFVFNYFSRDEVTGRYRFHSIKI